MNKQPEITDATRATFVEVFCALYKETPIDKITVKQLVERAGYSRATFYHYFHDVYEILEYTEDTFLSSLMESISHNIQTGQPLERFTTAFIHLVQKERRNIDLFLNNANSTTFMNKLQSKMIPMLIQEFGIGPENSYAIYALKFYSAGIISVMVSWVRGGQEVSLDNIAELIKGILEEGVLRQLTSHTESVRTEQSTAMHCL